MTINEILQIDDLASQYAFQAIFLIVLFAAIIFLIRKKINHVWLNFKTRYCLNRLGLQQQANFQWPDGLGHYFTIDRLILCHDSISLLVYKQYPGKIFCADHIDDWTQMLGQKSYRFKNPLDDLDCYIKAISASIPDVPVKGFLFFDHLADFPKGHPDRVIYLKKIPEQLKPDKNRQVEPAIMSAWEQLKAMPEG